jgi:GntR family transcriptional repressor for pyruvate dehydrogenase complex
MMDRIDYKVKKTNLYEQIANSLEQAIIRSGKKVDKLPSEQELCRRFEVSRTVIREALKVLKERGLIQSRNGEGSYIAVPKTNTISDALDRIIQIKEISNDDLHHTRLILEISGARLAAVNIRPDEIATLEAILQKLTDLSLSLEERTQLDTSFHITIVRASRNELLGIFTETMLLLLTDYMIKGIFGATGIAKTHKEHRKILDAIKAHDPDKTEKVLRTHLITARKNVDIFEAETKA